MREKMTLFSKRLMILTTLISLASLCPLAEARIELEELDSPITLQLLTPIDGKTAEAGDTFKAMIPEDHEYDKKVLPAGTTFAGTISKRQSSTHLSNPGYVRLTVTEATFPNGQTITFDGTEDNESNKIYHPKANNIKKSMKTMTPFAVVSLATQVPIRLFTNMAALPFTYASKAVLATGREFYLRLHPDWKPNHRVAYSMLIGTGIPGILFMASKQSEPKLEEGDNVQISLDERVMSRFFEAI